MPYTTTIMEHIPHTCDHCQFTKCDKAVQQPLHPLPRVDAGDLWSFNFIGLLLKTRNGCQYILTAMDLGTDFIIAESLFHSCSPGSCSFAPL
jgi:hypothetical protein